MKNGIKTRRFVLGRIHRDQGLPGIIDFPFDGNRQTIKLKNFKFEEKLKFWETLKIG